MPHLTASLPDLILTFLAGAYAGLPHAPKRLARDAGATVRSAENWLAGLNAPSVEALANLMAAHPALESSIHDHVRQRRDALRQETNALLTQAQQREVRRADAMAQNRIELGG